MTRADGSGGFRSLLLIVSGGIACYKAAELLRLLIARGYDVESVLTHGAQEFVTPLLFSALNGKQVHTDLFSADDEARMGHIALARGADAVIIAPATAHIIAKAANGMADDLASTLLLASDAPLFIAPAMNPHMYAHAAVQHNINLLRERGAHIISPDSGVTACGEIGEGRLPEPIAIADALRAADVAQDAVGLHILITSGATREKLDPVRCLTNFSSGKQGAALAEAFIRRGARVSYVHGAGAVLPKAPPSMITYIEAESADDMATACEQLHDADIAICAAAVCDWRPLCNNSKKLKKIPGEDQLNVAFTRTPDILHTIANRPHAVRPRVVAGFAAETAEDNTELTALAREKLHRKGCDVIIANNVASGIFGGDENAVMILKKNSKDIIACERADKRSIAARIADILLRMYRP